MLQIGSVLDGKYKILNEIGHGGMSTVYLALNERANKTWAVKEVRKEGSVQGEALKQGLIAETEMLKKLNHPNLPSIIDVIDKDDSFIIVMDYIEGRSLQDVLEKQGAQSPEQVVEWAKQLAGVLGYLHKRTPPIIYRDMKPANVMLKPDGSVTLIDFGTAREFKAHSLGDTTWLGTKGYAAPEQFGGQGETDARTDIFNLGATMYHLMTGYSPADTNFVILPLGDLRPELKDTGFEYLVKKCCEPKREDRFQSCEELGAVLEHIHDYDKGSIKTRDIQWRVWAATMIIGILGLIGTLGFKFAENSAVSSTYSAMLRNAQMATTVLEGREYFLGAAELQPTNPEVYKLLLDKIQATSEGNYCFQPEEERVLDSLSPYLSEFERKNSSEYAEFAYELGRAYFFNYLDGYQKAANYLSLVTSSGSALSDPNKVKIATTLYQIADAIAKNENGGGVGNDWGSDSNVYYDRWLMITNITNHPETITEQTGGQPYAIGLYRELLRQISVHISEYKKTNRITQADFENAVNYAETYMKGVVLDNTANESLRELVKQTNTLISSTRAQIKTSFKIIGQENE